MVLEHGILMITFTIDIYGLNDLVGCKVYETRCDSVRDYLEY